jgi:hypothetical protein
MIMQGQPTATTYPEPRSPCLPPYPAALPDVSGRNSRTHRTLSFDRAARAATSTGSQTGENGGA